MIPMNSLLVVTWFYDNLFTRATLSAFSLVAQCPFSPPIILMAIWIVGGNRLGFQPSTRSKKHILIEEWQLIDD